MKSTRTLAPLYAAFALLFTSTALGQTYNYQSQFGTSGNGNGQFNDNGSVKIDPVSRNILVADCHNHRVQIFSSAGSI